LSLAKTASAVGFPRRSCTSRSVGIGLPINNRFACAARDGRSGRGTKEGLRGRAPTKGPGSWWVLTRPQSEGSAQQDLKDGHAELKKFSRKGLPVDTLAPVAARWTSGQHGQRRPVLFGLPAEVAGSGAIRIPLFVVLVLAVVGMFVLERWFVGRR
jgi:hypothetical protein